ncbi:glycosyltransferase family 2 protein [Protofrankia symbiont of Coriaria ruscifolia]|uniref:glycosyltransferase family 2 protein n=1 Tax=Protofrankia symbiont of Coriaria ruscifolia TaxID=1306542 RepID=UPI0013EFA86D|nr:glycosyltransferase [Protofrankia symbiont of Coriaria ruscifolia]
MTSVSVVVCSHLVARWPQLMRALDSIREQKLVPERVVLVVDGDDELLARLYERAGDELVLTTGGRTGLSNARNVGIAAVDSEFVAFLDDDAVADPSWLSSLVQVAAADTDILGVGGWVTPDWAGEKPGWFPAELLWTVGCSHHGLPTQQTTVRNVFGGCALFRRSVFAITGGFDTRLGRQIKGASGCEETELCIRASSVIPSGRFVHEPAAVIHHHVHTQRQHPSYVVRRCWAEGASKATLRRLCAGYRAQERGPLGPERDFILKVLPRGVLGGIEAFLRGRPAGLAEAGMIVVGTATTILGFLVAVTRTIFSPIPATGGSPVIPSTDSSPLENSASDTRTTDSPDSPTNDTPSPGTTPSNIHKLSA